MSEATFGKYRLIAELGHGGMADVFLAVVAGPVGSGFSKLIVVKRLRKNLAEEPEFIEMLVDEARISARLNHPNVVQTNEVGSVDNQYFLSMEYLDGQPLHRIQHRAQQQVKKAKETAPDAPAPDPFPKECQYLVLVDTLAGLHHAHELADYDGTPLSVVHRDVTPHNVFVTYDGQVKVVDFGVAKAAGRSSETRQGVVKGKVRYMAPEQALGQKVDRRADLFAVGIMLWEAATGKRLWAGIDDMDIVTKLVAGDVTRSPREVAPDVPEDIDRICQKALSSSADDRYATAEEMKLELEEALANNGWMVSARRRLGPAVAEMFADKRAETRAIIDRQLAALKDDLRASGEFRTVAVPDSSASLSSTPASSASLARVTLGATTTSSASESGVPSRRDLRKHQLVLGAVAGVLLVAIGVAAAMRSSVGPAKAETPPVTSAEPSANPAARREVHVELSAKPADARILIDGALVSSPYDARLPADGRVHIVRIEAKGYEPRMETIRFDADVSFSFVLQRDENTPDPKPTAPTAVAKVTAAAPAETAAAAPAEPPPAARPTAVVDPSPATPPATAASAKIKKPTIDTSEDPWKR